MEPEQPEAENDDINPAEPQPRREPEPSIAIEEPVEDGDPNAQPI